MEWWCVKGRGGIKSRVRHTSSRHSRDESFVWGDDVLDDFFALNGCNSGRVSCVTA